VQKDNLYNKIKEFEGTECFMLFRTLFSREIESYREANDSAKQEDVVRNQGAIAALRKILKFTAPGEPKEVYSGSIGD
jgi:hypothetical protein